MLLKNENTAGAVFNLLPQNIKIKHILLISFTMTSSYDDAHG